MNEAIEPGRESGPAPEWAGEEPLIFELGGDLARGPREVEAGVPPRPLAELLPGVALRIDPPSVPAIPEPVLARHLGRLARRNHNLHQGIYPLGSCTMKYNPVVNEELARLAGFADLHPYQDAGDVQGALQLMWELERLLCEITGMARISLQPAAGAHGEWTGLRMIQAYHAAHGDTHRTRVLIPNSAHGTNPASAALAGLEVVTIQSNPDGTVDVADVARHLDSRVAAIMMTNPNTLGVFEKDILEIARIAHEAGALLYYDGANLNALVGVARPGDMGFDVVHLNLHKTFSTPHGGGGPGSGPVGVAEALTAFLPLPTVERDGWCGRTPTSGPTARPSPRWPRTRSSTPATSSHSCAGSSRWR
jgi:glycine dehydrogenase subunit 2